MKEFFRKKVVSLKRNPKLIPLVILLAAFVYYSLQIAAVSETTLQIYAKHMGLCQFAIMLLSLLAVVCIANAFPRRKKVNIAMLVIGLVMLAVVILCDIHYTNCIMNWWNSGTKRYPYVQKANDALFVHMYITIAGIVALALMPVYTKLLGKINTKVEIEDNGDMEAIELSE